MAIWSQADKRWQLADWRVRPLSAEALHYARMDTHYLLYIYDCLKVPCLLRFGPHNGMSAASNHLLQQCIAIADTTWDVMTNTRVPWYHIEVLIHVQL